MISQYFSETISLAKKGRGCVSPNPEVGCIVVKNGEIIGRGFHEEFGKSHAEVNAILDAENSGYSVQGASLFVSLEPCSHCSAHKKTPPCADLLIHKKISEVYILHQDPNPEVSGKGGEKLRKAGISVFFASEKFPEIFAQYQKFYEKFSYWMTQNTKNKIPYITLKLAQSRDNFLGRKGEKTQISGKECREYTLDQRDFHQAILVGANTIRVDNPTLAGKKTQPLRIILDSYNFFSDTNFSKYRVFRDENFLLISGKKTALEICELLAQKNISSVFVEGGGATAQKFLESGVIKKYIRYTAPFSLNAKKNDKNNKNKYIKSPEISKFPEISRVESFFLGDDRVMIFVGAWDLSRPQSSRAR